jgi:hypothetical protein
MKTVITSLLAATTAALLIACGGSSGDGGEGTRGGNTSTTPPSSSGTAAGQDAGTKSAPGTGTGGSSAGGSTGGSTGGSSGGAAGSSDAGVAQPATGSTNACLTLVNSYRAQVGSPPLADQTSEDSCATDQATKGAADLAATGVTTFHKYFQQCKETYQNEGWYSEDDPTGAMDWTIKAFWNEGPPKSGINHYSVMIDPKAKTASCGTARLSGGGYWLTLDTFY